MVPIEVVSGQKEVYWKVAPGTSRGCSPTTPGPRTCSSRPVASVMIQCRESRRAGWLPVFSIRTV